MCLYVYYFCTIIYIICLYFGIFLFLPKILGCGAHFIIFTFFGRFGTFSSNFHNTVCFNWPNIFRRLVLISSGKSLLCRVDPILKYITPFEALSIMFWRSWNNIIVYLSLDAERHLISYDALSRYLARQTCGKGAVLGSMWYPPIGLKLWGSLVASPIDTWALASIRDALYLTSSHGGRTRPLAATKGPKPSS